MTYLNTTSVERALQDKKQAQLKQAFATQIDYGRSLAANYETPVLMMSAQHLCQNAQRFMKAMPRVHPHFAVKANPDISILKTLQQAGTSFEIASMAELDTLRQLGVDLRTVLYSNPIKSSASIKHAAANGVCWYCVDSVEEVQKIAAIKPDAKLYLRIEVSNEGSSWPLTDKFGADQKAVRSIIETAVQLNMQLSGVTFHVGSQCTQADNWVQGIEAAKQVFSEMTAHDLTPELLNLGGGYPLQYSGVEPTIEKIGAAINTALDTIPQSIQVVAEPGRYLVGSAGCLMTQVIGTATRHQHRWLYLDTGFYGGLMELADGFPALLFSDRKGPLIPWKVAGPTCDSIDVMGTHSLPVDLRSDDLLYIGNLGAYCAACACEFNGFPVPRNQMVA